MDLNDIIHKQLKNTKRLAVIGVGSVLMSDDAAGILVAEALQKKLGENNNIRIYIGNTTPENFTGEIKRFFPDHLIIIDAADLNEKTGSVMMIDPDVINGVSFSTHMLPMKVMVEYLKKEIGCRTTILGIQPDDVTYGGSVSKEVKIAVDEVIEVLDKEILSLGLIK